MTPEEGEAGTKKVNVKRQLVDHEVGPRSSFLRRTALFVFAIFVAIKAWNFLRTLRVPQET